MGRYTLVTRRKPKRLHYDNDGRAYFIYHTEKFYMDEIMRTHNNPWIEDRFPDYIHGMMTYNLFGTNLYIQIVDNGEAVRIWEH